jgi:uncharacterized protein (DUF697 family)
MKGFIKGIIYLLGSMVAFGITVGIVIAGIDYAEKYFAKEEITTVSETPSVSKNKEYRKTPVNFDYLSNESQETLNEHFKKEQ